MNATRQTPNPSSKSLARRGSLFLSFAIAIALFATAGAADASQGKVLKAANAIPNQYIVVLKDGATRQAKQTAVDGPSVEELAGTLALRHAGTLRHTFTQGLSGFALRMSPQQAAALAEDPSVAYVAQDAWMRIAGSQVNPPSWGLDRVDQRPLPLDSSYDYVNAGSGVDVYVVDTGVRATHADFGGRVDSVSSFTAITDGLGSGDCNGHGTAVASILGGTSFGVAKDVRIHSVRVFDCNGWGASSNLIAGLDWVTSQFIATNPGTTINRPAVVNMSLGMMRLQAGDDAVRATIAAGLTCVVAAGNDAWNACSFSPSGVVEAIVAGGSDANDQFWAYSNTGSCVDVIAPAVMIPSAFNRNDSDSIALTGTSAAAPFVSGAAALYLAANPNAMPAEVETAIKSNATQNAVLGLPTGTANRLLYSGPVVVDDPPVATFTYACARNKTCTFDATASVDDKGIAFYSWTFGDGAIGRGSKLTHRYYGNIKSITVTLTVTDTSGQSTTAQRTLGL